MANPTTTGEIDRGRIAKEDQRLFVEPFFENA